MGLPAIKLETRWVDILIARMQTDLQLIKLQSDNIEVMLNGCKGHNRDIRSPEFARANEVDKQAAFTGAKKTSRADCKRAWLKCRASKTAS